MDKNLFMNRIVSRAFQQQLPIQAMRWQSEGGKIYLSVLFGVFPHDRLCAFTPPMSDVELDVEIGVIACEYHKMDSRAGGTEPPDDDMIKPRPWVESLNKWAKKLKRSSA